VSGPDPRIPPPLADLLAGVGRAFEGDADAITEVVTDDVVWIDDDERLEGVDEVLGHFLAHGGWREVFVMEVVRPDGEAVAGREDADGDWVVNWTLWLRADSTSYRRDGTGHVRVADGRITRWVSTATEREDGSLEAWGGD
jgi:hypothetical protein